jgi:hypothetical protein
MAFTLSDILYTISFSTSHPRGSADCSASRQITGMGTLTAADSISMGNALPPPVDLGKLAGQVAGALVAGRGHKGPGGPDAGDP